MIRLLLGCACILGNTYAASSNDHDADLEAAIAASLEQSALESTDADLEAAIAASSHQVSAASINRLAQEIKAANPSMTDMLAHAWANHAKTIDTFANIIEQTDRSRPLYVAGNPDLTLYNYPIPGDGSCGYWSLDLTRAQAQKMIIDMIDGPLNDKRMTNLQILTNEIPGATSEVIKNFISQEIFSGDWMGYDPLGHSSMIDVLADLQGLDLVIYQRIYDDNLEIVHEYRTGRPADQIRHLLYTGNHYDRLLTTPQQVIIPYRQQASSSSAPKAPAPVRRPLPPLPTSKTSARPLPTPPVVQPAPASKVAALIARFGGR